ncbi:hypothetical protein, partial [Candidatus Phytoplasma sp. AldY-WA1]|uniref:hypothetical protein n=1 Tax=Candidatus Phytoplasma sp. AldY-WA1 TaxID=2852100 RepID=UPI00254C8B9A
AYLAATNKVTVKNDVALQDSQYFQKQEEIKKLKNQFSTKYHSFINQIYDYNGNIKPISPENVEKLKETYENSIKKDKIECEEIQKKIKEIQAKNIEKTNKEIIIEVQAKQLTGLSTEMDESNKKINELYKEIQPYNKKSLVYQTEINEKDTEILKEKLIYLKLIKQKDILNNKGLDIIANNDKLIEKIEINYEELRKRLLTT